MTDRLKPRGAKEVEEALRWALDQEKALDIIGAGSKRAVGRPSQTDITLDLSGLSGVTLYEPEELVLSALAGTPVAEVESLVDSKGQMLAFEPMDLGPVLGGPAGQGTIGGMLAANLSGPRRIKAGAARDHFLGFSAVTGRGETIKSGGRVVKNVTGYDLCKLLAGSWGTLSVMTEVTLKVMPKPEAERTLLLRGLDDAAANKAMTAALGSPFDVSGAAHLPTSAFRTEIEGLGDIAGQSEALTVLRLEGITASAAHRAGSLRELLAPFGTATLVEDTVSAALWTTIRDVLPFAADGALGAWPVWRIVCPPASGAALGTLLARETGGELIYDWGGGLIWAAVPPKPDAHATAVRERVNAAGGHATLIRAAEDIRRAIDVFHPQAPGLAALSERVRASFDPKTILNRGRLTRGVAA
ncbi:MAG: FAD-binding protein [Bradyrhizobium canariense]